MKEDKNTDRDALRPPVDRPRKHRKSSQKGNPAAGRFAPPPGSFFNEKMLTSILPNQMAGPNGTRTLEHLLPDGSNCDQSLAFGVVPIALGQPESAR